ncbi:MAG: amino acid/polyamine/organocation transporter, superfamily [Acidimicrobiales bacterium]|nr:amino acid/polyamine/organocation transporter, superfamily [Acidimicrobiales bacterium]
MTSTLKRILVGRPIASSEEHHQRLGKPTALAVFASDAISSTAYATEEILLVLLLAVVYPVSHSYLVPIAIAAVVLLVIVGFSYTQTIHAYPNGGGAYVVSRENISATAALVAGAALLVDYTLTVAVSISSGVLAIGSAFGFNDQMATRVGLALFFVGVMCLGNLRGVKESGKVFAVPTYFYVVMLVIFLGGGFWKLLNGDLHPIPGGREAAAELKDQSQLATTASLFIILRAFSSGAVVLSGVEAISNGVPAFEKPEARNASQTLGIMAAILGTGFMGISVLAHHLRPVVEHGGETVLSQMARSVFGGTNLMYYGLQFGTFAILIMAANTAYADFPRLSSLIARDGYLPRQLANRGDRLVFSNGILALSAMAGLLIVVFRAQVSALIPLYAVGVFTGFTLSQFGMIRHHLRRREPRWQLGLAINAVGYVATGVVLAVVVVSKFTIGAWIPVVVIPVIVMTFRGIHRHYVTMDRRLAAEPGEKVRRRTNTVIVLVGKVTKGSLIALAYARSLNPDRLVAVSVVSNPDEQERITSQWEEHDIPVELVTLYSPYRELNRPILRFVDDLDARHHDDFVTVVVPEFALGHWWEQLLHNQSALLLRTRLRNRPNTVVTSVPFHIDEDADDVVSAAAAE